MEDLIFQDDTSYPARLSLLRDPPQGISSFKMILSAHLDGESRGHIFKHDGGRLILLGVLLKARASKDAMPESSF